MGHRTTRYEGVQESWTSRSRTPCRSPQGQGYGCPLEVDVEEGGVRATRNTKVTITLTQLEAQWLHALVCGVIWDAHKEHEPITQFIVRLACAVDLSVPLNPFPLYFKGNKVSVR